MGLCAFFAREDDTLSDTQRRRTVANDTCRNESRETELKSVQVLFFLLFFGCDDERCSRGGERGGGERDISR